MAQEVMEAKAAGLVAGSVAGSVAAVTSSVVESVKAKEEGQGDENFEEQEEIQVLTKSIADKLSKECATGLFFKSGDKIPDKLLEKKNKQLAKWRKDQEAKGKILKKGKWSKQLDSIEKTTKDVKKDTAAIKINTDKILNAQEDLPEKVVEAIDKKTKAMYGKPKDQVEMGIYLNSPQVPVKVLNAILDEVIIDEAEKKDLKKRAKQFKASHIANMPDMDQVQELVKKHTNTGTGTEPPPAKKQRRSELCEVCNEHVPDVGDICQNCRPSSAGASGSCAGNASIALGEGTESKGTKAKGMGKGKGQGKGKGEAEKQTSKGGMGGRGGGKGKAKGKGEKKDKAPDVDSVV